MSLSKLQVAICVAGLALLAGVGSNGLARGAAEDKTQPSASPSRADRPSATEDLKALRLEIEALRKSLQAMRERVQVLEDKASAGERGPSRRNDDNHVDGKEQSRGVPGKIVVASPQARDITIAQAYVCQIQSQRRIDVRTPAIGTLREISVKEGQAVQQGDVLFRIEPTRYQAKYDVAVAKVRIAELEFNQVQKLFEQKVVSSQEVALSRATLDQAQAEARLSEVELNSTVVKAPFSGIVDQLHVPVGTLINERVNLATLSDHRTMRVSFNVPEARYLEYLAGPEPIQSLAPQIELVLANGGKFPQAGKLGAIEASFNPETGSIPFVAEFENPDDVLRQGQTGTVLVQRTLTNVVVIPQRAVFEKLGKRYVYVVDQDDVVHQREIVIRNEQEDFFVVTQGLDAKDRIVLDGVRLIRDGEKLEYEFRKS